MSFRIPFQDLRDTDTDIRPEIEAAVVDVIRSGRYLNGPQTEALEQEIARCCGTSLCVAVSTGLDALRLIFRAYIENGILRPGDEVIVPDNTFIATFLAVSDAGLRPVAAEPSPLTRNLDLDHLPLSPATRAIVPVHLYGTPCWNPEIMHQLRQRGIIVVEDNAQAIGARAADPGFSGSCSTGSLGDAAAISFYPAKNIGAMGDAGAVTTSDQQLATTIRELANYGSLKKYNHRLRGFNCRMDEMQAAILRIRLRRLEEVIRHRAEIAAIYDSAITNPEITRPVVDPALRQVWHQYVILSTRRDELRDYLDARGIGTEIHYPVPAHLQPCYADTPLGGPFPVAERLAAESLSLPIANISKEEALIVADAINSF